MTAGGAGRAVRSERQPESGERCRWPGAGVGDAAAAPRHTSPCRFEGHPPCGGRWGPQDPGCRRHNATPGMRRGGPCGRPWCPPHGDSVVPVVVPAREPSWTPQRTWPDSPVGFDLEYGQPQGLPLQPRTRCGRATGPWPYCGSLTTLPRHDRAASTASNAEMVRPIQPWGWRLTPNPRNEVPAPQFRSATATGLRCVEACHVDPGAPAQP